MRKAVQNLEYARLAHARRAAALALVGLLVAGLGGCAELRARLGGHATPTPAATQAPAPAPPPPADEPPPPSLTAIVNQQLQLGHYAEGERQLHRYLQAHPEDRAAQGMLHQLTVDPQQALGRASREYLVKQGDSYSTLAARYLGDGGRFLILARYNGSTNPSLLRAGQKLRLPASRIAAADAPEAATPEQRPAAASASSEAKARRLQDESLALLRKGQHTQALERMDEALDADLNLPAAGADAQALRQQLVSVYHQRAIVLYRDQQLDQAISLWNRVLAIEPGFEPATVYRARALELKQRLKQF